MSAQCTGKGTGRERKRNEYLSLSPRTNCLARALPSTTGFTASRCDGFGISDKDICPEDEKHILFTMTYYDQKKKKQNKKIEKQSIDGGGSRPFCRSSRALRRGQDGTSRRRCRIPFPRTLRADQSARSRLCLLLYALTTYVCIPYAEFSWQTKTKTQTLTLRQTHNHTSELGEDGRERLPHDVREDVQSTPVGHAHHLTES
jgi:hypothetical protein